MLRRLNQVCHIECSLCNDRPVVACCRLSRSKSFSSMFRRQALHLSIFIKCLCCWKVFDFLSSACREVHAVLCMIRCWCCRSCVLSVRICETVLIALNRAWRDKGTGRTCLTTQGVPGPLQHERQGTFPGFTNMQRNRTLVSLQVNSLNVVSGQTNELTLPSELRHDESL